MKLSFTELTNNGYHLHKNVNVDFEVCPVGGQNMHGKVERKIREINSSIEKSISNERLSLLQWETVAASISNSINNLPIGLGSITGDLENLDLLTPNRLRLGRNNDRSPCEEMVIMSQPSKIIEQNDKIFTAWFEVWLQSHVPRLMNQQKWYKTDDINVVLFFKQESIMSKTYQYGMIEEITPSKDDIIRKVTVKYRNNNENVLRYTKRAVRTLVLIKSTMEDYLSTELGKMACVVNFTAKRGNPQGNH